MFPLPGMHFSLLHLTISFHLSSPNLVLMYVFGHTLIPKGRTRCCLAGAPRRTASAPVFEHFVRSHWIVICLCVYGSSRQLGIFRRIRSLSLLTFKLPLSWSVSYQVCVQKRVLTVCNQVILECKALEEIQVCMCLCV